MPALFCFFGNTKNSNLNSRNRFTAGFFKGHQLKKIPNKKIVQMSISPLDIIGDIAYNNIIPGRKEVNR